MTTLLASMVALTFMATAINIAEAVRLAQRRREVERQLAGLRDLHNRLNSEYVQRSVLNALQRGAQK